MSDQIMRGGEAGWGGSGERRRGGWDTGFEIWCKGGLSGSGTGMTCRTRDDCCGWVYTLSPGCVLDQVGLGQVGSRFPLGPLISLLPADKIKKHGLLSLMGVAAYSSV